MFFDAVTQFPFPKPPPAARTSASKGQRDTVINERHALALEMRKHGYSYEQIAEHFETSPASIRGLVKLALNKSIQEPGQEVIDLELQRLDQLYRVAFNQAAKGDVGAINQCLAVMQRRTKYLGLDAPDKKEISGKDGGAIRIASFQLAGLSDAELAAMEEMLIKASAEEQKE